LINFFSGTGFSSLFSYIYGGMITLIIIVSLAGPLDRAMPYFKAVGFVFSIMTISSLYGISSFLLSTGFYPHEKKFVRSDPYTG
jgi:hypothetical protein